MSESIKEIKTALISNILQASSQTEVKSLVDLSLFNLNRKNSTPEQLAVFIDAMVGRLEKMDPMKKDEQEWSNISMARIQFQHIRRNMELTLCKN